MRVPPQPPAAPAATQSPRRGGGPPSQTSRSSQRRMQRQPGHFLRWGSGPTVAGVELFGCAGHVARLAWNSRCLLQPHTAFADIALLATASCGSRPCYADITRPSLTLHGLRNLTWLVPASYSLHRRRMTFVDLTRLAPASCGIRQHRTACIGLTRPSLTLHGPRQPYMACADLI